MPRNVTSWARPRRRAVQHEKLDQGYIVQTLIKIGGAAKVLGTRRSRGKCCPSCGMFVPEDQGTRQAPGVADVIGFLPKRNGLGRLVMIEVKHGKNPMSDDQRDFQTLCVESDVLHFVGDYNAFLKWLIAYDYIKADSVPHYRQPPELAR